MRTGLNTVVAVGVLLVCSLMAPVTGFAAQSKCDAAITKAAGKKAACKTKVHAKAQKTGGPVDTAKLAKCEQKFDAACTKAQAVGDCVEQATSCSDIEAEVDAFIAEIISNPAECPTTGGDATVCNTAGLPGACNDCCVADVGCQTACAAAFGSLCSTGAANDACNAAANAAGCADECCP